MKKDPPGVEPGCCAHALPAEPLHQELFSDLTRAKLDKYCVSHKYLRSPAPSIEKPAEVLRACISVENFLPSPRHIYDHPYAMRQGEMHQSDYNKENEIKETYIEENKEMRFNTKLKAQTARGHILHTWDMLLDTGEQ